MNDAETLPQPAKRRRRGGLPQGRTGMVETEGGRLAPTTGLIVAGDSSETALLWRALEALSWERRWLVWVAPPQRPSVRELQRQGLDLRHVLWIPLRPGADPLPVVERALACGHCSAVLAWPAAVSETQWASLQAAARQGQSLGLLSPSLGMRTGSPVSTQSTQRRPDSPC